MHVFILGEYVEIVSQKTPKAGSINKDFCDGLKKIRREIRTAINLKVG